VPGIDSFQTLVFLCAKNCDEGHIEFSLNFADFMHRRESTTAKLLKSDHKIRHVDLQAPGGIDGNRSIQEQILPIKYLDGKLLQTCGVW
jgi:hypothetical protein